MNKSYPHVTASFPNLDSATSYWLSHSLEEPVIVSSGSPRFKLPSVSPYSVHEPSGLPVYRVANHRAIWGNSPLDLALICSSGNGSLYWIHIDDQVIPLLVQTVTPIRLPFSHINKNTVTHQLVLDLTDCLRDHSQPFDPLLPLSIDEWSVPAIGTPITTSTVDVPPIQLTHTVQRSSWLSFRQGPTQLRLGVLTGSGTSQLTVDGYYCYVSLSDSFNVTVRLSP